MKRKMHEIVEVLPDSIAAECGLQPGDKIIAVNDSEIEDIFDYQYYIAEEEVVLLILSKEGEEYELEIEKETEEDLGIVFKESLMDQYHSCSNKCIFCFIDQMPPGMRKTLYFKDDDSRLSFLQGNYITLTNMKQKDIDRIIRYHLAPINISVHTTNPELRCKMLHNRFAGDIIDKIAQFAQAGIEMNSQIVLCKGVNDEAELDRTIEEVGQFYPAMESISIVPVGVTKYREGLEKLQTFDQNSAERVLEQIEKWQNYFRDKYGVSFVHASDEWFILAEKPFPEEDYYEGYGQLEDGVGMMRLLIDDTRKTLAKKQGDDRKRVVSIATAKLAYETIQMLAEEVEQKYPNVKVNVYCIENHFFGETITVTGLLTGQDIIAQLKEKELGEQLLLPQNVLKADEPIFLDDISINEMAISLQTPVDVIQSDGNDFVEKIISIRE